ncbi:MAG: cyclic nucleotide-binding domain-containing protein [Actinomycetota bacterium]
MTEAPAATTFYERLERAIEEAQPSGRDVWKRLSDLVDPAQFRPKLAPDIEKKVQRLRWGNDYAVIQNPRDQIHIMLTPQDIELLDLMDGTRSVKEIVFERFQEKGSLELESVADMVRSLYEANFLEQRYFDADAAVKEAMDPASTARRKARTFARTLSISWNGADRLVQWLYRRGLKIFFNKGVVALTAVVSVVGFVAFVKTAGSHRFSLAGKSLAFGFLLLLFLDYVMVFVHELGHALVLVHHGRRIKSAGFMIYFGAPAFFVESTDVLLLEKKTRLAQSAAGPFADMVVAAVASLVAWAYPGWAFSETLYKFAVLNYISILMNLIPLLELDGYWLLAEAIDVPDLRPRSLRFLRHDFLHKLRKRERWTKQEFGLAAYAILGTIFTVFSFYTAYFFWQTIFGGLVRRLWNGGVVSRIILVALGLFILGPIIRGALNLIRSLIKQARALERRIRFRLQLKWRVEAAGMIDALPAFTDIPGEVLNDLAGRVKLKDFSKGRAVFRQGDEADEFYVVRKGEVQIVEENPETGESRVLKTLHRGESFGELALLMEADRSATARATTDTELFVVDLPTFDRLLADMASVPEFEPTLHQLAELRGLPAFAHLESAQLRELLGHGEWVTLAPGQVLMEEGAVGDDFYAISSGQVSIQRGGDQVASAGAGEYVGEVALLFDVPRTATVVAYTPVRAFRLDRNGFDRLVAARFRKGLLKPTTTADRTQHH